MKARIVVVTFLLLTSPVTSMAAQCEVDGQWYDYNDPICGGDGRPSAEAVAADRMRAQKRAQSQAAAQAAQQERILKDYEQATIEQWQQQQSTAIQEQRRREYEAQQLRDEANEMLDRAAKSKYAKGVEAWTDAANAKLRQADQIMGRRATAGLTDQEQLERENRRLQQELEQSRSSIPAHRQQDIQMNEHQTYFDPSTRRWCTPSGGTVICN